jgi:hypothetical protein
MKLIVCWGTFPTPRPGGHPCKNAYDALKQAGHDFEVEKAYGLFLLPDAVNRTSGRQEAKRRTGKSTVPILILDDDTTIADSKNIVEWARNNPA